MLYGAGAGFRSYIRPDLLILDEVGIQFGPDTDELILYQIINGRYEEVLPNILISNLSEKELAAFIGERCIDRMREGGGAVVSFEVVSTISSGKARHWLIG